MEYFDFEPLATDKYLCLWSIQSNFVLHLQVISIAYQMLQFVLISKIYFMEHVSNQ